MTINLLLVFWFHLSGDILYHRNLQTLCSWATLATLTLIIGTVARVVGGAYGALLSTSTMRGEVMEQWRPHEGLLVLGVGATGSLLVKLFTRQGHHVSCGDRDPVRARDFLGAKSTIAVQQVNARNLRSILKAAKGCQLLINACPAVFNKIVMRAALRLGAHYLDTASHLQANPFRPEQFCFDPEFRKNKRWALIHAGAAPGRGLPHGGARRDVPRRAHSYGTRSGNPPF